MNCVPFSLTRIHLLFEGFGENFLIYLILDFLYPFKLALDCCVTALRESGTAAADEPNTIAPPSSLYFLEKMENRTNRSNIYFGTETSSFVSKCFLFRLLESELSFDSKDSEIIFD